MNIDTAIFLGFLVTTVVIGLMSSRGTNTIKQYAIGNRNFSTATIVATIVATWISGEFFYTHTSEAYTNGLYFIWAFVLGDFICLLLTALVCVPRMGEFLGKLSIAEAMGSLFGERVRVVAAIASFVGTAGLIAIQLKLAGLIFEYALNIPSVYGIFIATIIVTLYSSLGGIKSVTFTDVIQFCMFAVAIPLSAYTLLSTIDNMDAVTNVLTTSSLFDYKEVFDFSNPLALKHLFLFLFCAIPSISPQYFQRITIARNTKQAKQAFVIAALTCLILALFVNWIAVLILSKDSSLSSQDVVKYIISSSSFIGFKGVMLAGIMAMIMSTADSCINSTSVIIVHDFFKPLKMKFVENEIFAARIVSLIIGIAALALSLHNGTLIELFIITESFYTAVVSVPFLMALFGFRGTEKSVIIGMLAGVTTVIAWDHILRIEVANSVPVGMFANLIFLMGSHYLLKQPGGWVGIKDPAPLIAARLERKRSWQKWLNSLKNFDLIVTFRKNCPKGDGLFSILGFFVMISAFSSTHTLDKEYQLQYSYLIDMFYPITLFSSAALISYPLWLTKWQEKKIEGVIWNMIMFFVLICFSFLMVLISDFSEIQLMVFMVNLIILSTLVTWQWALVNIILGVGATSFLYHKYVYVVLDNDLTTTEFKIIYLLLLLASTLVIFLKPKQEYQELTEDKNNDLKNRIGFQEHELVQSQELKHEFLRNLQHEARTPIVGITSLGQILDESYEKLTPEQIKKSIKQIAQSSERLSSLVNNMIDLSQLSSLTYVLKKRPVNMTELVYNRLERCKRIYLENKELEFSTEVESDVNLSCDLYYITAVLDNLIINAIAYSKEGTIKLELKQVAGEVRFRISDEGIGIPTEELYDIFGAFTVSSKTRTPAGGRGVGLALCKKVIELHEGKIKAESDGKKGAIFSFMVPVDKLPS
jgi:Na+/proline symporter/signal transduction histidine kinase